MSKTTLIMKGSVVNINNGGVQSINKQSNKFNNYGLNVSTMRKKGRFKWLMTIVGGLTVGLILYFMGVN